MEVPVLFNRTVFRDLQSRIGSSKLDALFDIFARTTGERFEALLAAEPAQRDACLHQVTHMLVSTSGTLGFDRLSAESRAIMEGRRSGEFGELVAGLRDLADRSVAAWTAATAERRASQTAA